MLVVAVALAIAVGLAGTVLPVLPGLLLVAGATLVYGAVEGFGTVGTAAAIVIVALGAAGTVAGVVIPQRAAGAGGAPRSSVLVGVAGAIIGFVAVPVVGLPLGGLAGIYLAERARTGEHPVAWRTTRATLRGFGVAALVQLGAGLLMAATWLVWVVVG